MEIRNFRITGRQKETNRKKTFELAAISKEQAQEFANERNLSVIIEIQEIGRLPTQNQLVYAQKLKIRIDKSLTFYDLSALIDKSVKNDSDPEYGIIDFANNRKLGFSKHIGESSLYNLVFSSLKDVDKIAFFVFSIYKWVSDEKQFNLDNHPLKNRFYQFAETLKDDGQFLKSMNNYSGQALIYFGEITQKDGYVLANGSSRDTIAYKKVANYLSSEFGVFKTKNKKVSTTGIKDQFETKGKGCLVFIISGIFLPFLFLFSSIMCIIYSINQQ